MAKITLFNLANGSGQMQKEAAEPQLGVFWIYKGTIFQWSEPASRLPPVAGTKNSSYDHNGVWNQMCRLNPELNGQEYWSVPRGRVVWTANGMFTIFMSSKDAGNRILAQRIMRQFNLPRERTTVQGDGHYDPPTDEMWEDGE